jgi:hypothetical protein
MEARITLAEAIRELRAQLTEAAIEAQDAEIRFVPKTVEVELAITFDLKAEGGGGFKLFSLVDLSAKAGTENQNSHKVTLTLEPVGRTGPVEVRDTAP